MVDFNQQIDITKLSGVSLGGLEDIDPSVFSDAPVPKRGRGRPKKEQAADGKKPTPVQAALSKKQRLVQAVTLPKEYIPKYKPDPAKTKKKREYQGNEALSEEDKEYIAENARKIPYGEIADNLEKRRITVFRYMEKHGLLGDDDKRDSRIRRAILNDLHNQSFWPFVKDGNSPEELVYFEDTWCSFVIQMDDNVTPTEQMQLRRLIEVQISIDRITIKERKNLEESDRVEQEIQRLQDKIWKAGDDEDEVSFLQSEISKLGVENNTLGALRQNFGRDKNDLVKQQSKLMEDLNVTRANRLEKYDVSDRTWAKMLLLIKEEPRLKKQMAAYAYISFLATEHMRSRLTRDYTYSDGEVHPPMLLPEGCVQQEFGEMVDALYVPQSEG